jgi:RimJ/RimL family protein N-acetyltransferase
MRTLRPLATPMLILQTPRLRLRWFTQGDAVFMRRLLNDPGWIANIGDRGVHTRKQAAHWIQSRHVATYGRLGFGFWAVERLADNALIGMCGLIQRDTLPEVDLGYALLPRFRGQGYAREAAAACLRYAHEVLGLAEVWGITSPDNSGSAAVLQQIGLRDDGIRRLAGDERETWVFRAPARDLGDDHAQIDALVRRFFASFNNRDSAIPTLAALPHYFALDAVIRTGDPLGTVTATDVHGFIGPRAELLLGGRLRDFEEHETEDRTDIAGAIAQRWLRYTKRGTLDGKPFEGSGTKAMLFTKTRRGWKIASLAWHDDAPAAVDRTG